MRLAIPVFIAQVIQVLMGVVDTIMAGQVSPTDLAALSIATGLWIPVMLTLQGILLALTGIVAQHHGANDQNSIRQQFHQALYLAFGLTIVGFVVINWVSIPISYINMEPAVAAMSLDYINFVKFGLPAYLLFCTFRNVAEGKTLTKPALFISVLGLAVNIPANYIFIHGKFGMPTLGGAGCGVATAIVYWAMAAGMITYSYFSKKIDGRFLLKNPMKPDFPAIYSMFKMGLPISLATFFEVTLFACIPLFIASMGAVVVSGHQVAASVSTVLFMMPLSLAMAITIRVGNLAGQKNYSQMKQAIFTSFMLAIGISAIVASITFIGREFISGIYSDDPEVIILASSILVLACFYQLPDALQVAANGVLRGLKYTKPISYITFLSYWVIGFSLGYVLARTDLIVEPLGPHGFWLGIIVGLTIAAVLLITTVVKRLKNETYN
ncbi:multidrug resistance protein, MATE family [Pseudoalteromonas tunicata]|nr:multidrug resistance protein, MATE family [Pseudoalteromonas tunicata]